jgi:glycosyltransferase involved in cell wall biosynthesis
MLTIIYNLSKPEEGGVGRYAYELLRRLRDKIKFNEIDLSPSFGKNNFDKLTSILWRRKKFLFSQYKKFGDMNHFLQTEIFYPIKGKKIVTLHNPPPFTKAVSNIAPDFYSLFRSFIFNDRYKDAFSNADFLIANSQITRDGIIEVGFDENKVKVINLGVDDKFKIIKDYIKRRSLIGYVGSFGRHKRVDKLLKDWKENFDVVRKYNLFLYGVGSQFQKLRKIYDRKFNIVFCGKLKYDTAVNVYNSFKALIIPTKGESFGLPIIEAVACGVPVFVYNDAKITPEVKKYAIEIESISEVPEMLESIKFTELKRKAKLVKEEFNWDKHVKETIKVYKRLG